MTFNHVGHCVRDLDRAQRFYEGVLGFSVRNELRVPDAPASTLMRVPPPVGMTARYLERDGFVLELLHYDREGNAPLRERDLTEPGLTHLSFSVDDIGASAARAAELGGEVLTDTEIPGAAIMVRDPDGQLVELLPKSYRQG